MQDISLFAFTTAHLTRKAKPAVRVRGSKDFLAVFQALNQSSAQYKVIDEVLSALKENVLVGVKVPKRQWPKAYVNKYGINNLYKLDLRGGSRLTYTIVAEGRGCSALVLDHFSTHKEYELFFGY